MKGLKHTKEAKKKKGTGKKAVLVTTAAVVKPAQDPEKRPKV